MLPVAPTCALMAGYRLVLQFPATEPLIVTTDRLCCKGIAAGVACGGDCQCKFQYEPE
jgi:hypothetical protein